MTEQIEINPRVVLWAEAEGVDLKPIREGLGDRQADTPKLPNGQLWTVDFMAWTQARWGEYHQELHGSGSHHECVECHMSGLDGRFDSWLHVWVRGELP